jgi:hypothetical protein
MIVAGTGSPEASYIMASFLLFLSAGMTFITRAPKGLRERATLITEMEPGKLYSGYFIYQPVFKPVLTKAGDEPAEEAPAVASTGR